MMLSIFPCAFWPSICLLWRNVYLDLLATFRLSYFLLLSCMSCLCVLEIDPLLVALYTDIVSYSVDCFFVLFMVSFAVQKLLSFIRSHLFIFAFIFLGRLAYLTLILAIEKLDILPFLEMRNWVSGLGNDNLFQYSCLENSMDRGTWWATVCGVPKSWILQSMHGCNWVSGKSQLVSQNINLGFLALIILFLSTVLY